jgi:replicative DNA helicase
LETSATDDRKSAFVEICRRQTTDSRGLADDESIGIYLWAEVQARAPTGIDELDRAPTGIDELDRAPGGGLVPSSAVLAGGDPGIGKSTLCGRPRSASRGPASASSTSPAKKPSSRSVNDMISMVS